VLKKVEVFYSPEIVMHDIISGCACFEIR